MADAEQAPKKNMTSSISAALTVLDVFTKTIGVDDKGTPITEEWVKYATTSSSGGCTISDQVANLLDIGEFDDPDDFRGQMLRARADAIRSGVEQFKRGGSKIMPDGHLSLDEWGAISRPHVLAFQNAGIYSVQQLRDAPLAKLGNMRIGSDPAVFQEKARSYLVSRQDNVGDDRVKLLEAQLAASSEQMRKMEALLGQALDRINANETKPSTMQAKPDMKRAA
jgi:hypothetical protein